MSGSAAAQQVASCIQVPQLVLPVSSLEISDTELANPAVDVSCNLGSAHHLSHFFLGLSFIINKIKGAGYTIV